MKMNVRKFINRETMWRVRVVCINKYPLDEDIDLATKFKSNNDRRGLAKIETRGGGCLCEEAQFD